MGLASLLKSLWNEEYVDERDARFINDRVHANIQKDGTFSVVPLIYGGVTTAVGIAIEKRFQGFEFPAKVKMAVSGCPRNCAEATVKDLGIIATEGGEW